MTLELLGRASATRALAAGAVSVAIGLAVLAAGLAAAGYDPALALGALWRGAFGSWYALTSATLVRSVPLILVGLAISLAFRAGALNIGAEGQFYAGAIAATWVGLHSAALPAFVSIPLTWAAALIAGMFWAAVPAWLRVRRGVLEVISTLLLNFVAEALVSLLVQGPMQERLGIYPQSDPIAASAQLPVLPGTRLHLGLVAALLLAVGLWWLFNRTAWGFQLLAAGLGPRAAAVSGRMNVGRIIAGALVGSGAIAGLAGAAEVGGVSYALYQNLSPGYGFTGIAVALLARLRPLAVIATGTLFGALEAGAGAIQPEARIPAVAVYVVEAVIIIVVLLGDRVVRERPATSEPAAAA
ncbi:MAG: ABC transporter permease [Gemmatimonadota bacterium]|nr:ABC transporter permease [Gemmatimonadota bacterium]